MKDETLLTDEVIESLEMLTSRNYFREWIKNPTGYVAGSIAVRDLVNVVLFADACRVASQSGNSGQVPAGYVLVPVEPTPEILDEFDSIIDYGAEDSGDAWRRLLSAAPQASDGWIPVSERMPALFYSVLVTDEFEDMAIATPVDLSIGDRRAFRMSNGDVFLATHWQTLPDAPKVKP